MNESPFWLVWNPNGRNPAYQHQTAHGAIVEAERLARANPGEMFIVMQSVCGRTVNDLQKIDMRPFDEIPF